MDSGIAKVRCDRVPAVDGMNALEVLRYLVKSFIPLETLPTVRSAAHGIFQPVFVVVQILQRHGLRADVTSAERVVLVPANIEPVSSFEFGVWRLVLVRRLLLPSVPAVCSRLQLLPPAPDFNATNRFAEIAVAIMN